MASFWVVNYIILNGGVLSRKMKKKIYYRETRWIYLLYIFIIITTTIIHDRVWSLIVMSAFLVAIIIQNETKPQRKNKNGTTIR